MLLKFYIIIIDLCKFWLILIQIEEFSTGEIPWKVVLFKKIPVTDFIFF